MSKSLIQRIKATIQRSSKEKESTISSLEDAQNIEAAFKMFDTNNDGFIDTEEAKSLLEKLLKRSPTKTQLDNLFNTVDLDKDGRISLQEFSTMMNDRKNKQEAHKRLFAEYDTNHDGYISKEELHEVYRHNYIKWKLMCT